MDPLHSGDLPPRLPWEPTTPFRAPAPATPQHTTDSSMSQGNPLPLSICLCPSLTHFLPLPLCFFPLSDLAACSHNLPQAHSLRLIHHCLRPLYASSPKCQTLATKRKNRGTHLQRHTNTNEGIQDTDHMIMDTIVMIISLRMLKKSHMTFPRSPIRPMQIPKVMKKPIKP